ncbi:SIR2 family protein [Candidatus Amarolinea aalborgensis]|uniref:nSTAND1 domain-containing NTPase n=1 Tax=Candidatus Amarolinea aalborgensis TaxID=2249329 RepID=UPI003BF9A4D9
MNLTRDLAADLAADNALLFVGDSLRDAAAPLPLTQIAELLAQQISYDRPDRSLTAVARDFEALRGRQPLVQALRDALRQLALQPSALHELLAQAVLPSSKIITTAYDALLEDALRMAGKSYVLIVRDADVPYFDESKVVVIKMQGDLSQPDSLVITEDDFDEFLARLPTLSDLIRAFFATKTLIFLGYDLTSPAFKRLFAQVTRSVREHRRRAYAVIEQPLNAADQQYWAQKGVELVPDNTAHFLQELMAGIQALTPTPAAAPPVDDAPPPPAPLPASPYKGLDAFDATDAAIFFGRQEDSARLANKILANPLVVVYGESGSGKTSLLRAGVTPRLLRAGFEVHLTRVREFDPAATGNLPDLAARAVLVLDQAEELLLLWGEAQRQAFAQALMAALADRSHDWRVVLAVRDDFLPQLASLEKLIPGLLDQRYRLERLSWEGAGEAITGPAARFNVSFEPLLVERLLHDLWQGGVAPPQLQLVCERLYHQFGRPGATIRLADYQQVGGAAGILAAYLTDALAAYTPEEQPQVQAVLSALVTSHQTKAVLSADEVTAASGLPATTVTALLERLLGQRLLRRVDDSHFELSHDYLAARIAGWLDAQQVALKQAQELLARLLADWQARRAFASQGDFDLLDAQRARLHLTPDATSFLLRCAVRYNRQVDAWLALTPDDATRTAVLLDLLAHREAEARAQAAARLGAITAAAMTPAVLPALAQAALTDAAPEVRSAAAEAFGRLGGTWREPAVAVALADTTQAAAALTVLGAVRDVNPLALHGLAAATRRGAFLQTARRRYQRATGFIRQQTAAGGIGGAVGFGLGFGLLAFFQYNRSQTLPAILTLSALLLLTLLMGLLGAVGGAVFGAARALGQIVWQERPRAGAALGGVLGGSIGFALTLGGLALLSGLTPLAWLIASLGLALLLGLGLAPSAWPLQAVTALTTGAAGMMLASRFGVGNHILTVEAALAGALIGLSLALALRSRRAGADVGGKPSV